jgi:hypothetical protein
MLAVKSTFWIILNFERIFIVKITARPERIREKDKAMTEREELEKKMDLVGEYDTFENFCKYGGISGKRLGNVSDLPNEFPKFDGVMGTGCQIFDKNCTRITNKKVSSFYNEKGVLMETIIETIRYLAVRIQSLHESAKSGHAWALPVIAELNALLRMLDAEFATAETGQEEQVVLDKIIKYGRPTL